MDKKQVTLIVVSGSDIASTNQADELLKMHDWNRIDNVEGLPAYSLNNVRMWWMKGGVLWEDYLDHRWEVATGEKLQRQFSHPGILLQVEAFPNYSSNRNASRGSRK